MVLYELMHLDANLASFFLGDFQWFHMAVKLAPLSSPIGACLLLCIQMCGDLHADILP